MLKNHYLSEHSKKIKIVSNSKKLKKLSASKIVNNNNNINNNQEKISLHSEANYAIKVNFNL